MRKALEDLGILQISVKQVFETERVGEKPCGSSTQLAWTSASVSICLLLDVKK